MPRLTEEPLLPALQEDNEDDVDAMDDVDEVDEVDEVQGHVVVLERTDIKPYVKNLCIILSLTIVHCALVGFGIFSLLYIGHEWITTTSRKDWKQHVVYLFVVLSTANVMFLMILTVKDCFRDLVTEFRMFSYLVRVARRRNRHLLV
jgi:hypothetical protein